MEISSFLAAFQRRLFILFRYFSEKIKFARNIITEGSESIARYIGNGQRKRVNFNTGRINYALFLPYPYFQLSVYRISELEDQIIWEIGDTYVAPSIGEIVGRADLTVNELHGQNLKLRSSSKPHRLHANIVDWPLVKSKQLLLAKELATAAILVAK